jgi:hypothetical protein
MPSQEWWDKRSELQAKYVRELVPKELYERTAKAKDGKVISIRKWYEEHHGIISDKQAAVLAGWIAEEEME